jgi:DNA-binding transcriptional MerR regulator
MAAELGNNYPEYTIEEIKELIQGYANHRRQGFDKESYPLCDYRTIERHLAKYADVLQTEKEELEQAEREGQLEWEIIGKNLMTGKMNGSATAWIFKGKNKYGYKDRQEIDQNNTFSQLPTITIVNAKDNTGN